MSDLSDTIRLLRQSGASTACIFRSASPTGGAGSGRLFGAIEAALARKTSVRFVDEDFLSSYEAMYACPPGMLVVPQLETVPERSFQNLKSYLSRGGSLLVSSRDFFMREEGREYVPLFETRRQHEDEYFRRTAALLGLKPYTAAIIPRAAAIDTDFLPGLPSRLPIPLPPHGIWCATGSDLLRPEPPYGHAFPERYPVSRNHPVVQGIDPLGNPIATSSVFCESWEGGGRLVVVASNGEGSMLDPGNPWLAEFVSGAVRFCSSRLSIVSVRTGYACYRPGEQVDLEIELQCFHNHPVSCELAFQIIGNGEVFHAGTEKLELAPGAPVAVRKTGLPGDFSTDEYVVTTSLSSEGTVRSKASNGFVVWNDEIARRGPRFTVSGIGFAWDGRQSLVTGTNYYESHTGELMWLRPDVRSLAADLKAMSVSGINYLRIHYHHPRWFHDYLSAVRSAVPGWFEPAPDALPDEQHLRIFDAHVYLCQKLGIVYGGDLFTLLPEALGDPRGWYGVHDYAWLPQKIEMQKRFLELLIPRYIDVPGIAWDLYNEPRGIDDASFLTWARQIKETIRTLGDRHPITVGSEDPARYADVVDFFAEHRNFTMAGSIRIRGSKPEMLQEAWLDRPPTPEGERAQRDDMRAGLLSAFGSGLSGFAPWQWTNQARLHSDHHTFEGEIWDDRLGCCVRDDGTLKPAGSLYRAFSQLVHGISIRGFEGTRFLTDGGEIEFPPPGAEGPRRGDVFILHHDGGRLLAGLARGEISWAGTVLVQAVEECDIWFSIPGGMEQGEAREIFLRTDEPCQLVFPRSAPRPAKAAFCANLRGGNDLGTVELQARDGRLMIVMEDWFSGVWLHVTF